MSASATHDHPHAVAGERRLLAAFALTLVALAAEAVGGWLSGSLALLADAGHMVVDALALLLAWAGAHFARRPADARRSFGYARLEVLVGYTNALAQIALVIWIVAEAAARLRTPEPIVAGLMFAIAVAGFVINLAVLAVLGRHDHDDVNAAGARLHVLGDLLGSAGAALAALLIGKFGWEWTDATLSILVSLLILRGGWALLRRCAHILLEGTPEDVDAALLAETVRRETGIGDVHHVHVWQLTGGRRIATLHGHLPEGGDPVATLASIRRVLREHFGIAHATIQIESSGCAAADCHETTPAVRTPLHHDH